MPRVDFYLLNRRVPDGKLRTACRLIQKALAQGYKAYVQTGDPEQADRLDDLLWTFDQGSFIPHSRDECDPAPVIIGSEPPVENPPELLISLGSDIPEHFHVYRRIAEVIDSLDDEKQLARRRYKVYKDHGCELETHHINP
jgi:DNA polymerase-3 subunit chi